MTGSGRGPINWVGTRILGGDQLTGRGPIDWGTPVHSGGPVDYGAPDDSGGPVGLGRKEPVDW